MRKRDTNKEQLVVQEAIKMLVTEGFDGFSMNRLARNCDVSVATLYIYYHDKDDLVKKIGISIGRKYFQEMLRDFDPDMAFAEGLRRQWQNRARHALKFPLEAACYDVIRHSVHGDHVMQESLKDFKNVMGKFFRNAVERKELKPMSREVFWAIAYGPLYTLLRFHSEGKSIGGFPFKLTKKTMAATFQLVLKALAP